MNTSHHSGGAPDVFLKNASAATTRHLQRMQAAHSAIRASVGHLHNPNIDDESANFWRENAQEWERTWRRACKAMNRDLEERSKRHTQLWMEGLE